jgi:predicted NBD/HSP70 family sugar kinase
MPSSQYFTTLSKESKNLFLFIQKKGPLTKKFISETLNIKLTTLNRLLKPLFDLNLLQVTDYIAQTGGRPSGLIDVNPMHYGFIGLDISRLYINIIFTNLKLDILYQTQLNVDESMTPRRLTEELNQFIQIVRENYYSSHPELLGIGIGCVGPIDADTGYLLHPERFPSSHFDHVDLRSTIANATGYTTFIASGSQLALLAEVTFGIGKNYHHVAYINLGEGIRNSTAVNGHLLSMHDSHEDAFSKMHLSNNKTIDDFASLFSLRKSSILDTKKAHTIISTTPLLNDQLINAAKMTAIGLSNYIRLLSLDCVILSGPMIKESDLFYRTLYEKTLDYLKSTPHLHVNFSRGGSFDHNSIALGSAYHLALQLFL